MKVVVEREPGYRVGVLVDCPTAVARVCSDLGGLDREHFYVLHLDSLRRLIGRELVAVGTLGCTLTTVREVFKGAMLANSAAIILVHNHPSGDATPSAEDRMLTARLVQAGEILGVPVLDHVVISFGGWACVPLGWVSGAGLGLGLDVGAG